jgi:hypothetical protein
VEPGIGKYHLKTVFCRRVFLKNSLKILPYISPQAHRYVLYNAVGISAKNRTDTMPMVRGG